MTCCAPGVEVSAQNLNDPETDDETLTAIATNLPNGLKQLELAVPDVHCGGCISTIEKSLLALPMVETARVNLSTRRVRVSYSPGKGRPSDISRAIRTRGYRCFLLDSETDLITDKSLSTLVRALAVAGFAAANIMLFSVSIWSGADAVTRDLFHWISAAIAVPAVAYAGQPFFRSAFSALRHGALNMDVPISLAVLLALALSLFETYNQGAHAYFDAAVTLLFFLLVGRTLDYMMRERARSAVRNLARLAPRRAMQRHKDGRREHISVSEITPGMILEIAAGERLPVDAVVIEGQSDVDLSLVSGESAPEAVKPETQLLAGTTNITGPLMVRATRPAAQSFLARMVELMEAAEGSKAGYKRVADRAAAVYAPAVHILALGTFLGWGLIFENWHAATLNAIAVLIITCPCALALAVPIVHVVAAGRLFTRGIMMRDGAALERLAEIRHIAFDKTGTLTIGKPTYDQQFFGEPELLNRAAGLAALSRHPLSISIANATPNAAAFDGQISERPGGGIEANNGDVIWRLGSTRFCNAENISAPENGSTVWLSQNDKPVAGFRLTDKPRAEAATIVHTLKSQGYGISLLSGDRSAPVRQLAQSLHVTNARAGLTPEQKVVALTKLNTLGKPVLMVGDGLNDVPALRAAHVSMAPSSAADIGRNAADLVYTSDNLNAVPFSLSIARRAAILIKQNFGLALAYNCVAVPLAVSGQVTPLIAALAMSSSSILVTLNALRLRWDSENFSSKTPASQNNISRTPVVSPAE